MKKSFTRVAQLLTLLGLSIMGRNAAAQTTYVPAAVTGYNADVIANGVGSVISSTTNTIDRGNASVRWCFADSSFVNPSGQRPTRALPTSGFFRSRTTPGLTYQMGPSNGNNSLRIDGSGQGTLTLTNPQPCSELLVLATEGNGNTQPKTFFITFTDGSIQLFNNVAVPDWYGNGATPAIIVGSRVNRGTTPLDGIENQPNDPTIYEVRLVLSAANYGKRVQSLTVSKSSTDPVLNVMGISLGSTCQGTPNGGSAVASQPSVCPGASTTLSLQGSTIGGSITYQWQVSTDGGTTFTDISGATNDTYVASPRVTTQYRARVVCRTQSANSVPVTVTVRPTTFEYNCPPFYRNGPSATPALAAVSGSFTASPSGLAINATTGVIDMAASAKGTYTVTYTPTSGCGSVATVEVKDELLYPNIITPNKDGKNDVLKTPLTQLTDYHLQVYNRWGKQVFDSTDPAKAWGAENSPAGVYYYLLEYTNCAGGKESYRNWLEVMK